MGQDQGDRRTPGRQGRRGIKKISLVGSCSCLANCQPVKGRWTGPSMEVPILDRKVAGSCRQLQAGNNLNLNLNLNLAGP